ncbi:MAG: UbiA family prenyltransferase [Bacteroidetes bacterium]|nr:UbiA family prenyltransferase [Bacteroidota bacterium]
MNVLKLIRFPNLLIIALAQILIRYGLYVPFNATPALSDFQFALLILATLAIAAAGYVINDIYDQEIDRINKPNSLLVGNKISEKQANSLFVILNIIGVGIGFYLANTIQRPVFVSFFILISLLLYLYASSLKRILVVGNLLIAVLVAMSILIVPIFDLLPTITWQNQVVQTRTFLLILDFAIFAFFINWIREIVKDLLDIDGDKKGGINTLPIAIGRSRTLKIIMALTFLLLCGIIYYMYENLYKQQYLMLYFLVFIVGPLLYLFIKTFDAKSKKRYRFMASLLKIIMLMGICAMILFRYFY